MYLRWSLMGPMAQDRVVKLVAGQRSAVSKNVTHKNQ